MEFVKFLLQVSWRHIIIATTAGLISGCANALLISLISREVHQGHVSGALVYFAMLAGFILVTSIVSQFMLIHLSQNAIYELRLKLSQNILASPLELLERLKQNRLLVTLTDDIHTLTHAVSAIPNICVDLATVIGCFAYLAFVSHSLFLLTVASSVSSIWIVQTRLNKAQKLFFRAREEEDVLFKHFQAIFSGIKELKLNRSRRQDFIENELKGSVSTLRQKNSKAMESFVLANGFGQMSQFICLGLVIFILPTFFDIPLSILATYVLIGTFIALPMQNLLNRIPELVRGNIALRKIERMKLSLSSLAQSEIVPLTLQTDCQLQLQNVVYRYFPEPDLMPPDGHPDGHPGGPVGGGTGGHPLVESPGPGNTAQGHLPEGPPGFPGRLPQPPGGRVPGHPPDQGNGHHPAVGDFAPPAAPATAQNDFQQGFQPGPEGLVQGRPSGPPPLTGLGNPPMLPPHLIEESGFSLGPLTLTLQSGQLVFVVGGNGSGKSTLAKLISGLYPPQGGAIFLNGQRITEANVEWYRQHFSAIFTDFYLFESYLGFSGQTLDQRVQDYLRQLELEHKVRVENGVLSTVDLSHGQRKRLALLTAYLEDRPIYVFDEWAADQEPRFRELFYTQLLQQLKQRGKLVIVITHDERYFHLADHLIKLDYGQVEFDRDPQPAVVNQPL